MKIESSIIASSSKRSYEFVEFTKVTTSESKWVPSSQEDQRDSESELEKFLNEAKQLLEDQKPLNQFTVLSSASNSALENNEASQRKHDELSLLKIRMIKGMTN